MGERLTDEALRALVAATHPGVLVDGRAAVDGSGRCLECGEHLGHDPGYVWHAPTCRLEAMECEAAAVMPALRDAAPDLGREVLELRARCADLERRLAATRHIPPASRMGWFVCCVVDARGETIASLHVHVPGGSPISQVVRREAKHHLQTHHVRGAPPVRFVVIPTTADLSPSATCC